MKKIQIIQFDKGDYFVFVDGKIEGRCGAGQELFDCINRIAPDIEIKLELYPGDALFKLLDAQKPTP